MCRDAIKGHTSLYQHAKILHRDASKNNIIIADAENDADLREMLIDLDLAKELKSGLSGARHRTGTMEFMAIEVLQEYAIRINTTLNLSSTSFCGSLSAISRKAARRIWQRKANFDGGIQEAMKTLRMQREATWIMIDSISFSMNFLLSLIVSRNSPRSYAWHYPRSEKGRSSGEPGVISRKCTHPWWMRSIKQFLR